MALVRPVRATLSRAWFAAGALVAAIALGYGALHLPPVRRLALRLALGRLERSGIVARADGLDYNLATLRFHLTNLTLATPASTAEPFFAAKDVRVRVTPGILFGRIVLKDVALDEPRVVMTRTGSGGGNWPGSPDKPSADASPLPRIAIEHARVTGLTFRWQDPQSSADIGVSFELTSNGSEASGRIATTRPALITWMDHRTTVQTLDGRLSWNGSGLGIGALTLRLPEGTLTADGRIDALTSAPRVDLHIVADADLAALAPWLDAGRAISGTSHADVRLVGALARPDAVVALTGRRVLIAGVPPADVDAALRITGSTVTITSLGARLAGGTISASGQASLDDGPGAVRAEWQNVDLASVVRNALNGAGHVVPAARLSGTLDARWTAPRLEQLQLTASAHAVTGVAGTAASLPVDGTVTFALQGRRWQLTTDDIGTAGARLSADLSGSVNATSLAASSIDGSIHTGASDVGRLVAVLARAGVIRRAANITGTAAGDFAVSGRVDAPSLDGPFLATVGYESLPTATVRAHATIAPDGVRVQEIDARLGASSAQGEVEWSSAPDALRGRLDASVAIDDFAGLTTAIPERLPLDGRLGVSASLSGTLAHARATIAATSSGLDVAGQHVDRAAVELSADLQGSRFVIDRLTLASGNGRLDGRGDIDLTRDRYTAHVTASDLPVTPLIGLAYSDLPASGRLSGSFDGEGSFSNLDGRGRVSLDAAHWKDADLGTVTADVALSGRTASVSVNAPAVSFEANGTVGTEPQGAVAFRGNWTPGDLGALALRLGLTAATPIGGSASVRFELNGSRGRLDSTRTVVAVDALNVIVSGQTIRLARPGQIEYDGRTARAGNIGLTTGTSTLSIDGSLGDDSISDQAASGLTASLDGMLADFAFVRDLVMPRAQGASPLPPPAGSIQLRATATGSIARPAVTGTFQVTDGRVPLTPERGVTGIGIRGKYDAGVLTVERAAAAFEGATFTATARVPSNVFIDRLPEFLRGRITPADGLASLSAQLASVTQAVAAPFVDPATLDQLGGRIDATVQLEADRVALERVRGSIALDRAVLTLGGISLDQQTTTRVSIREGRLTVDAWEWGGGDNRLTVRGGATLGANSSLNLAATSVLDLRVLNILTPSTRMLGRADAEIRLGGSVRLPTLDGWVTVSNGEARVAEPRLIVSDIAGTVTLAADTVTFQRMFAYVNGGESEIAGTIQHRWFTPLGGRVTMVTNGAALAVEGLRAEANLNLALEAQPGRPVINGTVTLIRSAYRERLSLTSGLLKALRAPSTTSIPAPPSVLDRLRLDVRIVTESDLLVDNNYGKLTASADLRLVGTVARPSLTGRTTLGEGGSIFFGTRRYRLQEGGSIDFVNPNRIEPDLNLTAVTRVQNTEITLTLAGTPATLDPKLTSDNAEYTQSDLVSLLLTGQTASNATAAGVESNGAQLLGLLSGEFLGTAGQALGLSTLRIENNTPDERFDAGLVATETDPGARLTIGRNIGSRFEVVFSQSLQQSGELTWILSYAPKSNLNLRVVNLDSGDRIYDFRHDLTFGRPAGTVKPAPRPGERVVSVQLSGAGASEAALRARLKIHEGDRFSFFRWQDDRERVEDYYHERDRLEVRVVTRRIVDPIDATSVSLTYDIRPGPRTTVQVQGFMLSSSALRDIRSAWTGTVVDDLLAEEAVRIARDALADEGYVQASITTRIRNSPDEKQLTLLIETGTHASSRDVRFTGNHGEPAKRLQAVLAEPRLRRAVWIDPDSARNALVAFYRANGYLNAVVRLDPILREGGTVVRPIQIEEGEPFRIRDIRVDGAHAVSPATVLAGAGLSRGEIITEYKMEQARIALDQTYRSQGFNSVALTLEGQTSPDTTTADISVRVDEGRQQRLRDVVTMGVEHTRPSLVSRALRLDLGEPVNLAVWNESRRRLYETGAFRSVDMEREPIADAPAEPPAPDAAPVEPVRALVTVQEWPRFRFRYGLEINDTAQSGGEDPSEILPTFQEGGRAFSLGATTDFAARNLFGRAVTAGVAARYTRDFRAARTYLTMPTFFGRRIVSNVWLERSNEGIGTTATGIHPASSADVTQFTFEQRIRLRRKLEVQYGYALEQNHTRELHHTDPTTPAFDITATKASLTSSVILDRRNDYFDATGGWFHASNVEYSPDWLSPDTRLARFSAEQRYYYRRGKIVLASWGRVGLATGFDQDVLSTDRFFAGGGSSVRGYAEEALSPANFLGDIVGGNALIVLNQEIRFPLFPYVRGVGFIDAGRAFETVGQMSFRDLSAGTGIGFRVQTPVVLLRVDMGIPLDASVAPRRPRWFFSIGQMF